MFCVIRKLLLTIIGVCLLPISRLLFPGSKRKEEDLYYGREILRTRGIEIIMSGLNGIFVKSDRSNKLVIIFKGNSGVYEFSLDIINMFNTRGYSVLMFNYPGYGKSKGFPNKFTFKQYARDVLTFATRNIAKEENIIVYSISMGSGPASYISTLFPKAKYIFDRPFSRLSSVVKHAIKRYSSFIKRIVSYIIYTFYEFDNLKELQDTKSDITFLFPQNDELIPLKCFEKLSKCVQNARVISVPGGHGFKIDDWIDIGNPWDVRDPILDEITPRM